MGKRFTIDDNITVSDQRRHQRSGAQQSQDFWKLHAEYWAERYGPESAKSRECWAEYRANGGR